MRHTLLVLASAILLLPTGASAADELLATVTVEAGQYDRVDTPIRVPLPEAAGDWGEGTTWLRQTHDGKTRDLELACQVERGTPPHLAFVLPGRMEAGTTQTFKAVYWPTEYVPPQSGVEKREGVLEVRLPGRSNPVLRYHTAQAQPPEGVEKKFAHEAYIHPAWTPKGRIVTDDYPPDHKHQRGIWFSWTKTEYEGRHPDFWNLGKGTAYTRFAGMGKPVGGPVFARFDTRHEHLDLKAPGGPTVILREDWTVRAWGPGRSDLPWFLWDLVSRQRCATNKAVHFPKYYYGGLGYRGNRAWLEQVWMRTSEGKTRTDGNESTARWLDVSGPLDGDKAGCLILIHPENFRYPQPLRLNPKQPQISIAPSQGGEWAIKPGEEYVSRYRFVVHDGAVDEKEAERLWRDFAHPPSVTVAMAGAGKAGGNKKPLKICMISGAREYEANKSTAFFKAHLERNYAVTCTHIQSEDKADSLPGIEALKDADLLFVFLRRVSPKDDQLRVIQEWCKAGNPVVGVRTASHAFQNWLAFDKEVLGGNYTGHYGHGPVAKVHLAEEAKGHPALAGVRPFASDYSLYKNTGGAKDVTLLATATAEGKTEPVAWTRTHNGGRVFYTSLGGPTDFRDPNFLRMLTNAVFWTTRREPPDN